MRKIRNVKRLIFWFAMFVGGMLALLPFFAHAQEPAAQSVDIIYPSAPTGVAGGLFDVVIEDGIIGEWGDLNCSGRIEFSDVLDLFFSIGGAALVDCRSFGTIATITDITFPDFGLTTIEDGKPKFADLNRLIELGAIDSILFTVDFKTVNPGVTTIKVTPLLLDDDNGDVLPFDVIEQVLVAR